MAGRNLAKLVCLVLLPALSAPGTPSPQKESQESIRLSQSHLQAVRRLGSLIIYFDANYAIVSSYHRFASPEKFLRNLFTSSDEEGIRIDAIHWFLPLFDFPNDRASWTGKVDPEVDIVSKIYAQTRQRGIPHFYVHRMNGGTHATATKRRHPEWCFATPWTGEGEPGHWNFAYPEMRRYVAANLVQIAREKDLDGLELDFARGFVFPPGEQWLQRDKLTHFVRDLRTSLLKIGRERGRPLLLGVRVPENLLGNHYDGLDLKTWVREKLVDILVPGCRSFEVDVPAFRRLAAGSPIKIYPALDDHHSSDGYCTPPIEVFRGLVSNWRRQGADGLQAFNFAYAPFQDRPWWRLHQQFYREVSRPEGLGGLDKTFVAQRRGGGHGLLVHADPENWFLPRHGYANTNMFAPLPAPIGDRPDLLLRLFVGDDLQNPEVEDVSLWLLLHDPNRGDYVKIPRFDNPPSVTAEQLPRAVIRDWYIPEAERQGESSFPVQHAGPARGTQPLGGSHQQPASRVSQNPKRVGRLSGSAATAGCWRESDWHPDQPEGSRAERTFVGKTGTARQVSETRIRIMRGVSRTSF